MKRNLKAIEKIYLTIWVFYVSALIGLFIIQILYPKYWLVFGLVALSGLSLATVEVIRERKRMKKVGEN